MRRWLWMLRVVLSARNSNRRQPCYMTIAWPAVEPRALLFFEMRAYAGVRGLFTAEGEASTVCRLYESREAPTP